MLKSHAQQVMKKKQNVNPLPARGGVWRMMNFRQRMGWIGVGLYLLASVAVVYYVFEIDQTYNRLTLEHVAQEQRPLPGDNTHPAASSGPPSSLPTWTQSLKTRLLLLPFWVWVTIFLVPYLQVFLFLYSCTRADPKTVGYCILPICLAVLCNRHQTFAKASNQISRLQLIDT
ncbi:lysosomal enzyme trafficking factor isoform X1 [Oncorhynchus keta]|uniref:lysosomal enzyme trafficking factor isoform X1 n=2 Tax=Oncorhynchus keta TaxID=8018 RepID=UPI0015F8DCBE|nr:lysosomal enzyme trafficking factor isoform X1 [Oncorhynchus keta]XP_035649858.1 lysosomal enzyme trafficking factor isoform X1 [Oncorhynchus keta]